MWLTDILFHNRRRELIARLFKDENANSTGSRVYRWILKHYELSIGFLILIIMIKIIITVGIYNTFVNLNQAVVSARADIEGCLQMRENLIPQLVTTMGDFVKHEDTVFFHSADVRAKSINPGMGTNQPAQSSQRKADTAAKTKESYGENLFSKLFAVAERYPELKTSESFQILMSKAADVEKEILDKRVNYNYKAYELNKKVTAFPEKIYAFFFRVKPVKYFQWNGAPEWVSRKITE